VIVKHATSGEEKVQKRQFDLFDRSSNNKAKHAPQNRTDVSNKLRQRRFC